MSNDSATLLPSVFPTVKGVTIKDTKSDLSENIRLVTSNIYPQQRKAMRSILNASGVKVVANKKKFIVEATVHPQEEFPGQEIPKGKDKSYHELEVTHHRVLIDGIHQGGIIQGTHSLGLIYQQVLSGLAVPDLTIRDWSDNHTRSLFIDTSFPLDLMVLPDWYDLIDRIATMKYNYLGVPVYSDFGKMALDAPFTEDTVQFPENTHKVKNYDYKKEAWVEKEIRAFTYRGDFYKDLISYAIEKGITIIPCVCLYDNSSIDKSPAVVEKYCSDLLQTYYPTGIEYFSITMPGKIKKQTLLDLGVEKIINQCPCTLDKIEDIFTKTPKSAEIKNCYQVFDPAWLPCEAILAGNWWNSKDDLKEQLELWAKAHCPECVVQFTTAFLAVIENNSIDDLASAKAIFEQYIETCSKDSHLKFAANSLIAECEIRSAKLIAKSGDKEAAKSAIKAAMKIVADKKPDIVSTGTINNLAKFLETI